MLYCISVWGGTTKTQLVRMCSLVAASLGWKQVEQLVRERDTLKVYRALHQ